MNLAKSNSKAAQDAYYDSTSTAPHTDNKYRSTSLNSYGTKGTDEKVLQPKIIRTFNKDIHSHSPFQQKSKSKIKVKLINFLNNQDLSKRIATFDINKVKIR